MAESKDYERTVAENGTVRYKRDGKFVKTADVPEEIKAELDGNAEAERPKQEQAPVAPIDSPDDIDDQSGEESLPTKADEPEEEDEEEPYANVGVVPQSEEGMGWPRKGGYTVDIFDGKTPHTHLRYVDGETVPLTEKNFIEKSDAEIIAQVKKIRK